MQTDSVAWITERKNTLSMFFALAALLWYWRFSPPWSDAPDQPRSWRSYTAALLLYMCALLSKTVTCSLPAVILLLSWWRTGEIRWKRLSLSSPSLLGLVAGRVTSVIERDVVGASVAVGGEAFAVSVWERTLLAGRALCFMSANCSGHIRSSPFIPNGILYRGMVAVAVPRGCAAPDGAPLLWRRRIGRGPLVAWLVFAGVLVPALGFVDVYPIFIFSPVADHFQYHASTAAIASAAALLWRLPLTSTRAAIAGVVLVTLSLSTWQRAHVYTNSIVFWEDRLNQASSVLGRPRTISGQCCWTSSSMRRPGPISRRRLRYIHRMRILTITSH